MAAIMAPFNQCPQCANKRTRFGEEKEREREKLIDNTWRTVTEKREKKSRVCKNIYITHVYKRENILHDYSINTWMRIFIN